MSLAADVIRILDYPSDGVLDPDEFIQAAMQWHFDPETGSPYWLDRAKVLEFDPRRDVRTVADLTLFPCLVNEWREVPVEQLIPKGYGERPEVFGIYESGGTTGAPKRVVCMSDWMRRSIPFWSTRMRERGCPAGANILAVIPTGPHVYGVMVQEWARHNGGLAFTIDMDPRWVKKCVAEGRAEDAGRYAEHLIGQAEFVLQTQDVGVLVITPPLLERLSRHEKLVELVNEKVRFIQWSGTHMDADTRYLFRTEVFPHSALHGAYGSTMILTIAYERLGLTEDACVFDTYSPFVTFSVVDPSTQRPVPYGQRGQIVMNHVSKGMLLPNNLERDMATRIEPSAGQAGDSVAEIGPVETFDNQKIIEGVY